MLKQFETTLVGFAIASDHNEVTQISINVTHEDHKTILGQSHIMPIKDVNIRCTLRNNN